MGQVRCVSLMTVDASCFMPDGPIRGPLGENAIFLDIWRLFSTKFSQIVGTASIGTVLTVVEMD